MNNLEFTILLPTTTSKSSIIKAQLKDNYQKGYRHYIQKEYEFGLQKHLSTYDKLPWVTYKRLTSNHIIIWLNDPKSNTSPAIS